jgi:RpiR family transcriptional regulator, carbohydrate utilization regulator
LFLPKNNAYLFMPKRKKALPIDPARNILEVISTLREELRKSDEKVANLVLQNPTFVLNSTLAKTARRVGVSEPTVIRFCVAIGCSGFQDFKLRLARSLALGMPATHSVLSADDSPSTIVDKIFDYTMNTLNWARRRLDKEALVRAVDALEAAKRIDFFGFGASGILALDAQQKFPLFGVPCLAHTDSHQQFMAAAMMGPGDVAVAFSNTGQTVGIIEIALTARQNGATVIGVSGSDSPLLRQCDIGLIVETLDNTDLYTPTISRIAGMVIIDTLATAVALRRDAGHDAKLVRMKRQLTAVRSGQSFVLHPDLAEVVPRSGQPFALHRDLREVTPQTTAPERLLEDSGK